MSSNAPKPPGPWTSKSRAGIVGIFFGGLIAFVVLGLTWGAIMTAHSPKPAAADNNAPATANTSKVSKAPADNKTTTTVASAGAGSAPPAEIPRTQQDWWQFSMTGIWGGAILVLCGLFGMLIAWWLDREHFRVSQSMPMPLDQVKDGDLVWVSGEAYVPKPVTAPEIDIPVGYFKYERQEKQANKFVTVKDETKLTDIYIKDGDQQIRLEITDDTDLDHLHERKQSSTTMKWEVTYIAAEGPLNACGKVDVQGEEDGERDLVLKPISDMIDMKVTPVSREMWTDRAEAEEIRAGTGSTTLMFIGALVFFAGLGPVNDLYTGSLGGIIGLIAGVAMVVVVGVTGTLARFGRHYNRLRSAWAEVANDFDQRRGLLNQLVETAQARAGQFSDDETAALQRLADELHKAMEAAPPADEKADANTEGKSRAARKEEAEVAATRVDIEKVLSDTLRAEVQVLRKYLKAEDVTRDILHLENEVTFGRQHYNTVAGEYNQTISGFPRGMAARLLGFKPAPFWTGDDSALAEALDPKQTKIVKKDADARPS
ncbi:MAG: LemA family protein [Planctomycetota bacterium]